MTLARTLTSILAAALSAASLAAVPVVTTTTPSVTGAPGQPAPTYDTWEWAPAATAAIHPGTQTVVEGGQCTSNFVFVRTETVEDVEYLVDVLLGYAGHCAAETGNSNECLDVAYPVGHPVRVDGDTGGSTVAYNASITMIDVGETDNNTCMNNDFGLVRIAFADWGRVNPSMPTYGGPLAVATGGTSQREDVYSWGNSGLRLGLEQTSPKQGISLGTDAGGWNHNVHTVTPGIPGDSGSGYLDADGNALGVVSTVEFAPFPASNNVTDLERSLRYVQQHDASLAGIRLEPGTEPFDPGIFLGIG